MKIWFDWLAYGNYDRVFKFGVGWDSSVDEKYEYTHKCIDLYFLYHMVRINYVNNKTGWKKRLEFIESRRQKLREKYKIGRNK